MRSEPTSAPICRENQSFPRFIAKGKDFLLTQFYFSDVEAVLAGYIWGAIAHAQVRSCTEIMTRDYLNGYQDIRYLLKFLVERKAIRYAAPSVRSWDAIGPRVARRGRGGSVWWGGVGAGVERGAL